LRDLFVRTFAEECPKAIEDLGDATKVEEWAKEWGLTVFPWILDHARNTRDWWKTYPNVNHLDLWHCVNVNVGEWRRVNAPVFSVRWDPRSPEFDRGDPNVESKRGIFVGGPKKVARERIREAIDRYLDSVEKAEKKAGFEQYKPRIRDGRTPSDRMKWVVMRVCRGMTFDKIYANLPDPPKETSTIRKAVNELIQNLNFDE